MKIRTQDQLLSKLDSEFSWRNKEISDYTLLAKSNIELTQRSLIRGGIALAYAHLEGFVKMSSEMYLAYIESRNLKFSELNDNFLVFAVKKHLSSVGLSNNHEVNTEAVRKILIAVGSTASFLLQKSIDTESNLKSKVLVNIAFSIGLNISNYQQYCEFIDEDLLARRNKIAHGEFLLVTIEEFERIMHKVVEIMRMYKTDIENAAIMEEYRRK